MNHEHDFEPHAELVRQLCEAIHPRLLVEIGVNEGGSLAILADAAGPRCKCYGIDPYQWTAQTTGVGDAMYERAATRFKGTNVWLQRRTSRSAWPAAFHSGWQIDVLHIDGDHRYEHCRWDFDYWSKMSTDRGVILVHDYAAAGMMGPPSYRQEAGVKLMWDELVEDDEWTCYEHRAGFGLGIVARPESPVLEVLDAFPEVYSVSMRRTATTHELTTTS